MPPGCHNIKSHTPLTEAKVMLSPPLYSLDKWHKYDMALQKIL